jgi:hypothetical protein
MSIPPIHASSATAPRLLEGPRNIAAAANVPAVPERGFGETQGRRGEIPTEATDEIASPAAGQAKEDRVSAGRAEAATYAYLSDAEGRLYLVDASATDGLGAPPASEGTEESSVFPTDAYAERALGRYAAAATGFVGVPARLSIYV